MLVNGSIAVEFAPLTDLAIGVEGTGKGRGGCGRGEREGRLSSPHYGCHHPSIVIVTTLWQRRRKQRRRYVQHNLNNKAVVHNTADIQPLLTDILDSITNSTYS